MSGNPSRPFPGSGEPDDDEPTSSVFGSVDQSAIIAKLDANDDDDLGSTFFADSIQDVEDAAANVFDIGIRTLTVDPREAAASGTFGTAAPPAPAVPQAHGAASAGRTQDSEGDRVKAAFILGGPEAAARARRDEGRG